MPRLQTAGWDYSIGVRQQPHIRKAITAIPEDDWQPLSDYPDDGEAQIAETVLGDGQRLIVRRTRLLGGPGRALARLATLRLHHQPHRTARPRRGRAPPTRRRRTRDPRPQRPSTRALPLRQVLRQRRLDGHRRPGAQPAAPDPSARASPARPSAPPDPQTTPAHDPRHASPPPPAPRHCGCPPAGPGRPTSSPHSHDSVHSRHPADPAGIRNTINATPPTPACPKTRPAAPQRPRASPPHPSRPPRGPARPQQQPQPHTNPATPNQNGGLRLSGGG